MKIKDDKDNIEEDIIPRYVNKDGFLSVASQMQENVVALNNSIVEPVIRMQESINGFSLGIQDTVTTVNNMGLRKVRMTKIINDGVNGKQYYVTKECRYKKQMMTTTLPPLTY